jgi:hypothetical protein
MSCALLPDILTRPFALTATWHQNPLTPLSLSLPPGLPQRQRALETIKASIDNARQMLLCGTSSAMLSALVCLTDAIQLLASLHDEPKPG